MNAVIVKYKWKLAWCCYALLIAVFLFFVVKYNKETWFPLILQIFGLILPVYPTVLIFIQSRADSEKAMRSQLDHLQQLNQQEVETMRELFQKQMNIIDAGTKEQIAEFKKTTTEQIKAIDENTAIQIEEQRRLTQAQIEALNGSTQKQIENYSRQTSEVVSRLEENSMLLAELLLRQLEEKLGELNNMLDGANKQYKSIQTWKLGRTEQEKQAQLSNQKGYISRIQQAINYVTDKFYKVKEVLANKS